MEATQVTLRNVQPSPSLDRFIRQSCDALGRFHPHILHCRVTLEQEAPGPGTAHPFSVTLVATIPGAELVVHHSHPTDAHVALRDAFEAMRRRLQDAAALARHEVKAHSQPVPEGAP